MGTKFILTTNRLLIEPLSINDNNFIFELVNTEGWLKFIGNRNIESDTDAIAYIERILANENISYWVVKLKENKKSIGIITFIKRDYLNYHDIGFAFLPTASKKGFAYEATMTVLEKLIKDENLLHILATTVPENVSSIKLLEKLGLNFEKEIEIDNTKLSIYGIPIDKLKIDITPTLFVTQGNFRK